MPRLATVLLAAISLPGFVWAAASPRPLVVWHGLGDSAYAEGMLQFAEEVKNVHPNIFVHLVYIGEDLDQDRQAGFVRGQFLRAYVERYNSPPVHNLLTFGAQHTGISDIPACRPRDFLCQIARRATKSAVYGSWAQENLVQIPVNLATYYSANHFLTSINNEIADTRNETYGRNLASLNKLVLVLFTEDKTVVPKESSWFASEQRVFADGRTLVPMHEQPLYKEDWIGLRELDERDGVVFSECKGEHMQLGDCWEDLVRRWAGGLVESV
ncbi:palmitoyl-protein thioesterase [Mycena filopes]|nr:palmitoyl-protein thioesterase [Mycena filopes]